MGYCSVARIGKPTSRADSSCLDAHAARGDLPAVLGEISRLRALHTSPDALPDFRNLGVIARILIGVNLAAFAAASYAENGWALIVDRFVREPLFGGRAARTRPKTASVCTGPPQ